MKNKMQLRSSIPAIFIFLLSCLPLSAQEADSLNVQSSDTISVQKPETDSSVIVNARSYSMQRRYRPTDKTPFVSSSAGDNSYLGISFGSNVSFSTAYSVGMNVSLLYGKWFSASHGLRIEPGFGIIKDNFDGVDIFDVNLYLSYMFNLTNYLRGYDAYRIFNLSTVVGAGGAYYSYADLKSFAVVGHLGLNFNFNVYKYLSFFVEPLYNISSDPHLNNRDYRWQPWVSTLKTSVGMQYNFHNRSFDSGKAVGKMYVFGTVGAMEHNKISSSDGFSYQNLGGSVNAGVGFVCKGWFEVRTALHISNCIWKKADNLNPPRYNTTGGLRFDAVFNILPMFNERLAESLFGIAFFLGPEFGYLRKTDDKTTVSALYVGASWGGQIKARINSHFAILLEPRFSYIPYSAPTDVPPPQIYYYRNYFDFLLSLNLGLRYSF